jgi:hypothetical protein
MSAAALNPKALLPQHFFLNTDDAASLRKRIASLVNNYLVEIRSQIGTIEAEVDQSGELRWNCETDTIGIVGGLPSELLPELTLQTKNQFKHSKLSHYRGGFIAKTYHRINTKLPIPTLDYRLDLKNKQIYLPNHPLLKTGAHHFWNRFRELVDPTNVVPTIPRSMLTRPPLTRRQLDQLLASIRLLEKASLDAKEISQSRTLEIDTRYVRHKPHFSN